MMSLGPIKTDDDEEEKVFILFSGYDNF